MAKRKILNVLTLLLIVATLFGVAIPVPVAQAGTETYNHIIPFTITDTSGVARTNVPVIINFDVDGNLVTYGLTNATCTNTYMDSSGAGNSPIGSGTAYDYLMATDNITVVIPSLPAYGSVTVNLYTGYSPLQTSFYTIVGEDGYITVADDPDLELSDNFTVEIKGWVDTSSPGYDKNLVYKELAFQTYISAVGNITAAILSQDTASLYLFPNATGNYTALSVTGETNHWAAVDDPVGSHDGSITYVHTTNAAYKKDAYYLSSPDWAGDVISVDNVTMHFRVRRGNANGDAQPHLRLGADETAGTPVAVDWFDWDDVNALQSELLARPGGGSWSTSDIESLQAAIGLKNDSGEWTGCTQIYIEVGYTYEKQDPSVTATGVESGEHSVKVRQEVNLLKNGDFENGGTPPTGWTLAGGGASSGTDTVTKRINASSANLTRNGADCYLRQYIGDYAEYRGEKVTLGAWIWASVAGRVRMRISDGVSVSNSSYHTGSSEWEWIVFTRNVDAGATKEPY